MTHYKIREFNPVEGYFALIETEGGEMVAKGFSPQGARQIADALEMLSDKPEGFDSWKAKAETMETFWKGATETHIQVREAYEKQNAELRSIIEGRLPTDAPAGFARRLLGMSMEDRDYVMSIAAAAQPAEEPSTGKDSLQVEPAPAPGEEDALDKMEAMIEGHMMCEMGDGEPCLRCDLLNLIQFARAEKSALRSQLARKDERMRKALEEAAQSLEALAGLAGKDETMLECDQVRGYALNRAMAARAALREPDGRKGE